MSERNMIEQLLWSYFYNREDSDMEKLCYEVMRRIDDMPAENTDDGDIIYGWLISMYGDYGTSPRSGWFTNEEAKKMCIDVLTQFVGHIQAHKNMWGD